MRNNFAKKQQIVSLEDMVFTLVGWIRSRWPEAEHKRSNWVKKEQFWYRLSVTMQWKNAILKFERYPFSSPLLSDLSWVAWPRCSLISAKSDLNFTWLSHKIRVAPSQYEMPRLSPTTAARSVSKLIAFAKWHGRKITDGTLQRLFLTVNATTIKMTIPNEISGQLFQLDKVVIEGFTELKASANGLRSLELAA